MTTISINGISYLVDPAVKSCMANLKHDRDWNYEVAKRLDGRVIKLLHALRIIKGISTIKQKNKQQQLFK